MPAQHWYNNINSQLDATVIILLIISISSTCFGRWFRPSSGALDSVPPHSGHQQAASSVLYTRSCKHSLVLLRMGEIIARNTLSRLKLLIKLSIWLFILLYQWCTVTQISNPINMYGHNSPKLNSLPCCTVTAHTHTSCSLDVRIRFFRISLIYSAMKFCIHFSFSLCIVIIHQYHISWFNLSIVTFGQ